MYLENLHTENFRNLRSSSLQFSDETNLFLGGNGQGKTNLLEAIYFLGNLKSFRKARRSHLPVWGKSRFGLKGCVVDERTGDRTILEIVCERGQSRYKIDGERVEQIEEYFSRLVVMAFHPDSLLTIKGGPAYRRMFIDRGIFCESREHLSTLKGYNRVLAERRWILKNRRRSLLGTWDEKLIELGVRLTEARAAYIRRLNDEAAGIEPVPGEPDPPVVRYLPSITEPTDTDRLQSDGLRAEFADRLKGTGEEERKRGMTLVGPHRDEFQFLTRDRDFSKYGSQGQQREALLRVLFAQASLAGSGPGGSPLVLLDDVMSELDRSRTEWMGRVLERVRNQVFISALGPVPSGERGGKNRCFLVRQGEIEPSGRAA